jgi:serine/threonine protein kinase
MAPEVKGTSYTTKVDIYSTGILLYELFENKVFNLNKPFKFYWTPHNLRKLLCQMTHVDPKERPTAGDCLKYFKFT